MPLAGGRRRARPCIKPVASAVRSSESTGRGYILNPIAGHDEGYQPDERAVWLLKRAFHNGHRAVNDAIKSYGVTPTQMGALGRLIQDPGLSGAELARRLLVTPQAAQLALTSLEKRGLVQRTPDPHHGRIVRTTVTREGRRIIRACTSRAHDAEAQFLSVLDDEEARTLLGYLQRLAQPPGDQTAGDLVADAGD